jgi:hypothetical protein
VQWNLSDPGAVGRVRWYEYAGTIPAGWSQDNTQLPNWSTASTKLAEILRNGSFVGSDTQSVHLVNAADLLVVATNGTAAGLAPDAGPPPVLLNEPCSPVGPGSQPFTLLQGKEFQPTSIYTVNDGFIKVTEAASGCISDIVICWNGQTLPGLVPTGPVNRAMLISDSDAEKNGGNSCIDDQDIAAAAVRAQFANGGVPTALTGQTLATLTALMNSNNTFIVPEQPEFDGGVDKTAWASVSDAGSQTYVLADPPNGAEGVPALPGWAFALFAGVLALPGIYLAYRNSVPARRSA